MSPRRKLRRRLVIGDENNDRKPQQEEEVVVAPENNDGMQQQEEEEKQEKGDAAPAPDATNNNLEEEHQSDSDSSMNSLSKFILKPIGCPGGYVKENKKWEEDKTNNDNEKKVNEKIKKKKKKKKNNNKSGGEDEKEQDGSIAGGRDLVLALACQGDNNVSPSKGKKIVKALQTGETSGDSIASRKGKRIVKALQTGETSARKTMKKQKIEESDMRQKVIIDLTQDEKKFVCLKEYLKVELQEDRRGVVMERLFTLDEKRLEEFDAKCQSLRLSELELSLKKNQLVAEVLRAAGF